MSQEDVELVRRGYEALNRGDHEAWLQQLHEDVELHELATSPDAGVYRGHAGIRRWLESVWAVAGDGSRFEPQQFTDHGRFVLVSVRAYFFAGGSDVPIEARLFHVFELEDGKARRILGYLNEHDALDALARRE